MIKVLHKRNARLVTAEAGNRLENGLRLDIDLEFNNQRYLLDVGFSNDPK